MKRSKILALTTTAFIALAAVSTAAAGQREGDKDGKDRCEAVKEKWMERIAEFDTDGNGELSDTEKAAIKKMRFDAADADKSGGVTLEELTAYNQSRMDQRKEEMAARHFSRIDKDGDGVASLEEFDNGMRKMSKHKGKSKGQWSQKGQKQMRAEMIEKFDADGDGKLSDAEKDAAKRAKFEAIDANSDGKLTSEEITSFHEAERVKRKAEMQSKHFEKIDADADGVVSLEEFSESKMMKHDRKGGNDGPRKDHAKNCK
ncbi:EF-hand domain-containing protein [Hirschia baltica]|uniref:Calcium-binding EF-hand-containing protein n=1 Tax=Hirschia baltica (strain ATCC 49814 / DSM 5838 / IFAM 1418) TaxID=582402 RepID=C6XIM8_HIRBI|nr:EF-hand domain-containing protein [Hirschia baltica]ACT58973.1 Calcium-binding EF-hand-containing protein [Hirschia baltica ATCC 49814]